MRKLWMIGMMLILMASLVTAAETWDVTSNVILGGPVPGDGTSYGDFAVTGDLILVSEGYTQPVDYLQMDGNYLNAWANSPYPIYVEVTGPDLIVTNVGSAPQVRDSLGGVICSSGQIEFGDLLGIGASDTHMFATSTAPYIAKWDLATCSVTKQPTSRYLNDIVADAIHFYGVGPTGNILYKYQVSDFADVTPGPATMSYNFVIRDDDTHIYGKTGTTCQAVDKVTFAQTATMGNCDALHPDGNGKIYYSLGTDVYKMNPDGSEVEQITITSATPAGIVDGIWFRGGVAYFKTYSPGAHTVYTSTPTICTPDWNCTSYDDCVEPALNASCNAVTDNNACGESYTGNYSEFTPQECVYPESSGGSTRYIVDEEGNLVGIQQGQQLTLIGEPEKESTFLSIGGGSSFDVKSWFKGLWASIKGVFVK